MRLLNISADNRVPRGLKGAHYSMLEEFHKHWESIDIMVPYHPDAERRTFFGNVHFHVAPRCFPHSKLFHNWWVPKQGKIIAHDRMPDVIALHEGAPYYNSFGAFELARKLGRPLIAEYFHISGHPRAANLKEWIYKWVTILNLKFRGEGPARYRVMNQQQVGEFLVQNGVSLEKIVLLEAIYLDLDVFSVKPVTKIYDLVICGNLEENKGHLTFIEGVKKISGDFPNLKALIIGEGSMRKNLEARIERLGLQANVELYGWAENAEEIASLYRKSRICVCMSYSEGGPRFTMEAMACGLPVISTPVGIMPDYLSDGQAGELVEFGPDSLCRAASKLLSNPDKLQEMSHCAREKVKHLDKAKTIRKVADAYKKIAEMN